MPIRSGGGWPAVWYAFRKAREAGGFFRFYRAMRSRNACKTCALGMGGQQGGMVDESGRFPEVCKKSLQAMASDMQGRIAPAFFSRYGIADLRAMTPRELEHLGRVAEPVHAGPDDTHYRPISWDEAIARCIEWLKQSPPDRNFFYASGRSSNEAAFLLQLFARIYGTNNVNNCSFYCHQASGVGLASALGAGTATVTLDDLHHCDLFFLIGGNPASNHPRLMRSLAMLRRRGGRVVVMNPMIETGLVNFKVPSDVRSLLFGSDIASEYIQPHIGGDIAFLTGLAKRIDELNEVRAGFVSNSTEGFDEFIAHCRRVTWDRIVESSGVERAAIDRVARMYVESRATIFGWTMGITHHLHGVDNVRAIVNLALLRGMVGRPHAGLLPIRGHSNVQGVGSVGVTPQLKEAVFERLKSHFGVALPTSPGMDTLSCMEAMREGRVENAWCLGGNLFGSNPDANATAQAFSKLESVVYFNTTLNTGHAWGRGRHTLILPVRARDEEAQPTTQESMFNYVRMSDGGPARLSGSRGEVELIATIARGVLGDGGPIDWAAMQTHVNIRKAIAAIIPGYEAIGRMDETKQEFQIEGRTFHQPRFMTPSGKAKFHVVQIPDLRGGTSAGNGGAAASGTLRLMTVRSEGQFNTVVYEDDDLYRNQDRRDVILLNAADIEGLGLRAEQHVTVRSEAGEMRGILVRPHAIRAGNAAMYFPEANVLVPPTADPESRTPAFKAVAISIEAEASGAVSVNVTRGAVRREAVTPPLKSC